MYMLQWRSKQGALKECQKSNYTYFEKFVFTLVCGIIKTIAMNGSNHYCPRPRAIVHRQRY